MTCLRPKVEQLIRYSFGQLPVEFDTFVTFFPCCAHFTLHDIDRLTRLNRNSSYLLTCITVA